MGRCLLCSLCLGGGYEAERQCKFGKKKTCLFCRLQRRGVTLRSGGGNFRGFCLKLIVSSDNYRFPVWKHLTLFCVCVCVGLDKMNRSVCFLINCTKKKRKKKSSLHQHAAHFLPLVNISLRLSLQHQAATSLTLEPIVLFAASLRFGVNHLTNTRLFSLTLSDRINRLPVRALINADFSGSNSSSWR